MGRFRIKATECKYSENDRRLQEQFINGIKDKAMTAKTIKEYPQQRTLLRSKLK